MINNNKNIRALHNFKKKIKSETTVKLFCSYSVLSFVTALELSLILIQVP